MQKQIKITVSKKTLKIVEAKAKKIGLKVATYVSHLIVQDIRKEADK